jgi:Methyltransferase domain
MTDRDLSMWRKTLDLVNLRYRHISEMAPIIDLLPDGATIAEVGVFAGEATVQFMRSPKVHFLICVDNWKGGYDDSDWASNADMAVAEFAFRQRMRPFESRRWSLAKVTSFQASFLCQPGTLDMVYIDANHSYESLHKDIGAWMGAVKAGGWVAGHDYNKAQFPGVVQAVEELVAKMGHLLVFPDTSWAIRKKD